MCELPETIVKYEMFKSRIYVLMQRVEALLLPGPAMKVVRQRQERLHNNYGQVIANYLERDDNIRYLVRYGAGVALTICICVEDYASWHVQGGLYYERKRLGCPSWRMRNTRSCKIKKAISKFRRATKIGCQRCFVHLTTPG